jgi:hypothetical protein
MATRDLDPNKLTRPALSKAPRVLVVSQISDAPDKDASRVYVLQRSAKIFVGLIEDMSKVLAERARELPGPLRVDERNCMASTDAVNSRTGHGWRLQNL